MNAAAGHGDGAAPSRRCRFVLTGHDAGGTIPPMIALAEEMTTRGHDVTVLSQPSVRARSEAVGCRFVPIDGVGDYVARTAIEEQFEVAIALTTGTAVGEQLRALAVEGNVDAVVVDCNLAGAAAAAETLPVPSVVLFHSMFATFTDVWFADLWPFMGPAVNDTRRSFGLQAAASWTEVFDGHDRLLSVVPEEFEAPVAGIPEQLRHFGFLTPRATADHSTVGFPPGDDPTVLVGLSTTYQQQEDLLTRILDALGACPVRGLVTTSGQVDPVALPVPANVTLVDSVNHGLVLDHTDAVITHAGLGTVAAALSHGVPLVGTPLGRDQHLNAQRVADLGAGIALLADATSDDIAAALLQVLSDPGYRAAARAISSASAAAGGAKAAVDDVESLLRA